MNSHAWQIYRYNLNQSNWVVFGNYGLEVWREIFTRSAVSDQKLQVVCLNLSDDQLEAFNTFFREVLTLQLICTDWSRACGTIKWLTKCSVNLLEMYTLRQGQSANRSNWQTPQRGQDISLELPPIFIMLVKDSRSRQTSGN